jgi:hypothetical protein
VDGATSDKVMITVKIVMSRSGCMLVDASGAKPNKTRPGQDQNALSQVTVINLLFPEMGRRDV